MIEVLKQMTEALEDITRLLQGITGGAFSKLDAAIQAGRKAIAELESQEPVAWLEPEWREKICPEIGYEVTMTDDHPRDLCWIPLYATPPTAQRTWVGLTDEEIEEGIKQSWVTEQAFQSAAWWAEDKLKQKNGFTEENT